MRNRFSLGVLFACAIAAFAFLVNAVSQQIVSKGVNEIELRDAETDMKELYSLLNAATIRFKHHVFDWAVFDEAYAYIQGKDDTFIARSFSNVKIDEMHFTGTAVYDRSCKRLAFVDGSKLVYGEEWAEAEVQAFDSVVQMMAGYDGDSLEGFINVKNVPMLVTIHKIYDSFKKMPFNGYLVMGISIDKYLTELYQNIKGLQFSILPLRVYNMIQDITVKENIKYLETSEEIRVYSVINDIFGKPAFSLELRKPRTIAAFGQELSRKNSLLMLLLCTLVLCAGLVVIHLAQQRGIRHEMEYRVRHDNLTDLPNAMLFHERLAQLINAARHGSGCLGVLFIDIDNFKSLNDCYGYQLGDAILCEMANRLRTLFPHDLVSRPGADKFLIAVTADNEEIFRDKANAVLPELNKPVSIEGDSLHMGASIGYAVFHDKADDSFLLLHRAEFAMHVAKNSGGNAIRGYNETMRTAAIEKKHLEVALREAVENNAFTVHYQPKVDIEKNDVAGCEALVRWQIQDGKWVPPPVFIPIAEETGLVSHIDMFVLRTACRQVLAWQKDYSGAVPIAVNMSVRSVLSDDFLDNVMRILQEEGTPPSLIDIEITESSFMTDMQKALTAVTRLHELGIHIALDDFGTGYSSLQYLSAMPISVLKIDKKFVDDIFSGKEAAQPLIKGIISLAVSLGMHTVSEGVENRDQLDFLVGNGACVIQGYLFSKPLSAADCGEYLRNRKARIEAVLRAA